MDENRVARPFRTEFYGMQNVAKQAKKIDNGDKISRFHERYPGGRGRGDGDREMSRRWLKKSKLKRRRKRRRIDVFDEIRNGLSR